MNNAGIERGLSFQQELEHLNLELAMEFEMSWASERMEICELFDKAEEGSVDYGQGYADGFWLGRQLLLKYMLAGSEASENKHKDLLSKWGMPAE